MTVVRRPVGAALALGLAGVLLLPGAALSPAGAAEGDQCNVGILIDGDRLADAKTDSNPAFERMHVDQAHELATGEAVTVAVIDSGVQPAPGAYALAGNFRLPETDAQMLLSGHGTIVAGLIAGPNGMAPDSRIYDVRVFDREDADSSQGEQPVNSSVIARGIRQVLAVRQQLGIKVVNISLSVDSDDPVLRKAVADLVATDVVVVASAGNKEVTQAPGFKGTEGSDADVFPADYPGVLAVSAVPPSNESPAAYVRPNAQTDVAAPTVGAISQNITGQVCAVQEVATSWSTAAVSGLAALLRERFPNQNPAQIQARIMATTEGAGAATDELQPRNKWTGAGVVQALDALTRQVDPDQSGFVAPVQTQMLADAQAPPPPERIDLFGSSRALLLWTGLIAGSLLALAFIVRPLLRR